MTLDEKSDLHERIDRIAREQVSADLLIDLEIRFEPDHLDEDSIFIVLHMEPGRTTREYADAMTQLSDALVPVTDTSDGFLFPYISPRIEEEAA